MPAGIEADIQAAIHSFSFNEGVLRRVLTSRSGPVMQEIARRAIRVEASAKAHASGRPGPMVRTGRLRGSITWRLGEDAVSPYADVGTAVLYAPFLELGTQFMPAYPFLRPALEAARG